MPRHLTAAEIDDALRLLRAKDTEVIARGRGGDGFAHRAGQLYTVYVEENDQQDTPMSEEQLRAFLAELDLDDYSNRYWVSALNQLGLSIVDPKLWG
jgi:hypothetical protein